MPGDGPSRVGGQSSVVAGDDRAGTSGVVVEVTLFLHSGMISDAGVGDAALCSLPGLL